MKSMTVTVALASAVGLGGVMCSQASAQPEWVDETTLNFGTPVQVPGKVLPPGTYKFRLVETQGTKNIVQIFDGNGKLVTTTISVPKQRLEPTGDIYLAFAESKDGTPVALRAWFYPGKTIGHEFVYSKDEARDIADRTQQEVLTGEKGRSAVTVMSPGGTEKTYSPKH
jgi:hypothetical protein